MSKGCREVLELSLALPSTCRDEQKWKQDGVEKNL